MQTFVATFIPGFKEIIKTAIERDIADVSIVALEEASITFKTSVEFPKLQKLPYVSNIFYVLAWFQYEEGRSPASITKELHKYADYVTLHSVFVDYELNTFRIMVQQGNQLTHIPKEIQQSMQHTIARTTGLDHAPLKADIEVWVLIRNEGTAFLGVRETVQHDSVEHKQGRGELRPQLAYVLNMLAEPTEDDVMLDPFAGSGSIPLARATYFPAKQIIANDIDNTFITTLNQRLKKYKNVRITKEDAMVLPSIQDNSITTLITDPPWGMFQGQQLDYIQFYTRMLTSFKRVLAPDGTCVIITARSEEMNTAIQQSGFTLKHHLHTLVNGKKAQVFVIKLPA